MSDFLQTIPLRLRETIHTFCTDMWDGYLGAINELMAATSTMQAEIVVDRFHVAKNCRDGFDRIRKQALRRLKKELSPDQWEKIGKGMLWIVRPNHQRLDAKRRKRLRHLLQHAPDLHCAYTLREEFTALFNSDFSPRHARKRLQQWIAKVERSTLTCFDSFLKTLRNHLEHIVTYFNRRANSGFVEGLNNKLRVLTRRCYGIQRVDTLLRRLRLDMMFRSSDGSMTPTYAVNT